jgi:hypothetical protein
VVVIGSKMCLFPVRAQSQDSGKPILHPEGDLLLPCGKCFECKSKRASEWAMRCKHEIACHDDNCFITLTYDDDHLPSFLIVKDYFQKFMKKLRKRAKNKVKYLVSHEYGGRTGRPHHHAIIFGWSPPNQDYLKLAPSGEPLFSSPVIDKLWTSEKGETLGFHSIGEANEKTAYYIASYSLKSALHDVLDDRTGEVVRVSDSMNCSTRPAIGKEFFIANMDQILQTEKFIPRYYVKLLERDFPDKFEEYQNKIHSVYSERGDHERYAKFIITDQKVNHSSEGFRSAPEDFTRFNQYKNHLKQNRDFYKHYLDKKEIV